SKDEKNHTSYHFYDLNAKLNYRFSDRSRMYFNWYSGDDALRVRQEWYHSAASGTYSENGSGWKWGNMLASLNWNYVFSPQLFANMSAIYSRFRSDINIYDMSVDKAGGVETTRSRTNMTHNSGIRDIGYRMDLDWSPHPNHAVRFGSNYLFHSFRPEESGASSSTGTGEAEVADADKFQGRTLPAHEVSFYAEDDMDVTPALKVNAGLHFSLFHVEKKTYAGLQPRLSARYLLGRDWSVKASYALMNQYVHLLSGSTVSLPNDLWVPVTRNIRPMISNQFSTGVYHELNRTWNFSLEGYYKTMNNLIEYRDGASMFSTSTDWQDRVAMGRGTAYGIEWLAQKPEGRLNGWLGYGLSWADRQFPNGEINGGRRFWAKYDSRHKINLAAVYKLSDKVDVNGTWTYYTGGWMTVGLESYDRSPILPGSNVAQQPVSPSDWSIKHYESRNNYRMSDYHRLDLGLNIRRPKKNGHTGTWNISAYNVYARRNPTFAYPDIENTFDGEGNRTGSRPVIQETSILSVIPSISYTYTF
ncbi:MAG: hypothetical protein LBF85_07675, partial [Tannerella sp.]|nr:hypothetical protein [Tannerella sp.]